MRRALVEAAAMLFSERGPGSVTVRQIADRAAVNHGLVHRYFGSKDALVRAVLDHLAAESAAEIAKGDGIGALSARDSPSRRHGRILAYLILEGRDLIEVTASFPAMRTLIELGQAGGESPAQARQRAVQVIAMVLGWQLFEPFLSAAAGLPVSGGSSRAMLDAALQRLTAR